MEGNQRKKIFIVVPLIIFVLLVSGCRKTSKNVYKDCEKAVKIVSDYLDFEIKKEEASIRLGRINCVEENDNQNDILVCSEISLLRTELLSIDNNDTEIEKTMEDLKKTCGIK